MRLSLRGPATEERPPRPISKDPPRPDTAATTTTVATMATGVSYASTGSQRTIKYGTGRYAKVELSPQPSEDPADPLNWPLWKKHLNLGALLLMAALVGAMKTAYVSVNSAIAIGEDVSYTAAVALTAVPLMLSAVTGLASLVAARIWGKRPVYLVSTALVFTGMVWNTHVRGNLAENMAARVFQGLGWGAFDALVLGSIQDTYFEHERESKIIIHYTVSIGTMLGSPLLGGVASAGSRGFELQFEIMSAFLSVSILLLVFGAPETTYDRVVSPEAEPPTLERSQSLWPNVTYTKEAAIEYLLKMKPWSYEADEIDLPLILQAPRAMLAPTTGLLFTVTLLPYAGFWGLASSLSLLFSPFPFMLASADLGALMTAPFLLGTPIVMALALPQFHRRFIQTVHLATIAAGTVLASIGMLGFGLYVAGSMEMPTNRSAAPLNTPWDLGLDRVSLPVASFLLGLLAAGSLVLDATISPVIQRSTAFTSANLAVGLRNTADMHAGLACLRSLVAGAFILGLPNAVFVWDGLRMAALGMGVAQIIVAAAACGVYWYWDENVRRLDGRVMGLIDLSILKRTASFFDESD
ncbi:MFS general substrate transporter [Hypoxylon rubiginosum]|uniref:MFS general substrate transporter n=1 Tax=Hypoxylon rubiginosum TaxID=110542 RepID=A0ACB9YKX5_9PEZI|nr:MFS general substrate transporter [Hypoxylon rubiginosum]